MNNAFTQIDHTFNQDINSDLYEFEHNKTGARVAFIKNNDPNRVFYIAFKTPSNNSTGVAHILEHSTLCGSSKYPVKEPFVELAKGSLNTFLNAMTYPDKTVYPIASTNLKDYHNLMDVYLDAVFNPNIYDNPYTFMQEGWHYHIEDEEEPIKINGVVYNEMKGVYSDPDALLERALFKALFPNTIYSQESGGDPDNIPELSYQDFLNFHKTFYHPSNSYIYFYGDLDIDEELEKIDQYLNQYEKQLVDSSIKKQKKPKRRIEKQVNYPVIKEEENKDLMAYSFVLNDHLNPTDLYAVNILLDLLLDNNSSILKKRLLEAGIAADIAGVFETSLNQPVFTIYLRDTDINKKDEFVKIVTDTITELCESGIDKEELEAVININEFKTLETLAGETGSFPRGLLIGLSLLENWVYGQPVFDRIKAKEIFESLEKLKNYDGFEHLLKSIFLDNPHQAIITLKADQKLLGKKEEELNKKLKVYKENLKPEEITELVTETKELIKHQSEADTKEDLKTIPRLKIEEISEEIQPIEWQEYHVEHTPILFVESESNDIIYLSFNFDLSKLSLEELPYVSILELCLTNLDTKNLSLTEINKQIFKYTGGIQSTIKIDDDIRDDSYHARLIVNTSFRKRYLKQAFNIIKEILCNYKFDQKEIIANLVKENRINKNIEIQNHGNSVAILRTLAKESESKRLQEILNGLDYYKFISKIDENFEKNYPELIKKLKTVAEKVLNRNDLVIGVAAKEDEREPIFKKLQSLIKDFSDEKFTKVDHYDFKPLAKREAFITSGNVMFNAQGGKGEIPKEELGAYKVLRTILSMDYLWNTLRVLGGAYGASFNVLRNGEISMSSFRDPNLDKTYENYRGILDYINQLNLDKDEIDKYIIGTISPLEVPFTTKMKLQSALMMYYTGLTNEDRLKERKQILNTDLENLKESLPILEKIINKDNLVTIGTETAINNSKDKFDLIEYIN